MPRRLILPLFVVMMLAGGAIAFLLLRPKPAPAVDADLPSQFYLNFDNSRFTAKYSRNFEFCRGSGSRSLGYIPTQERFKVSDMTGVITDDRLAGMLTAMKLELRELAAASGVKVTAEPSEKVGERPVQVLAFHFSDINLRTLRGFHFPYTFGTKSGAVDVFAAQVKVDGKPGWEVAVMVHESAPMP